MKKSTLFLIFVAVVALICVSSCSKQKAKYLTADAFRMMRVDSTSMILSWNYHLDTLTLIRVYIGKTSKDEHLVFNGLIAGNGSVEQVINIRADQQKSFFISIYAENPERLLFEKELINVLTLNGYKEEPWSHYAPKN